jgi:hypothetical protein
MANHKVTSSEELMNAWKQLMDEYPDVVTKTVREGLLVARDVKVKKKKSAIRDKIIEEISDLVSPRGDIDEKIATQILNWERSE